MARGLSRFTITALTLGFAFLYLPILLLVIYSFNASKLVTVWGGFSLEWYRVAFANTALLESAWVTLRVAALSSTLALILGTMAGVVLTRIARFPGRTLFAGLDLARIRQRAEERGLLTAGQAASDADLANGIVWAVDHGARTMERWDCSH